jgi:hypothetical protein
LIKSKTRFGYGKRPVENWYLKLMPGQDQQDLQDFCVPS